jgi:two-component system response regulator FixJ
MVSKMISNKSVVHVIDDDEAARASLGALLEAAEFPVRTHESAMRFLSDPPEIEFGCIITDLYMPHVDGIELVRRLRDRGESTPVIVTSGQGEVTLATRAMRAGAVDFLEKPIIAEVLLAWVRSAIMCQMCSTNT